MSIGSRTIGSVIAAALWLVGPASAAPISSPLMLRNAIAPSVKTVQFRRGYRGGYRGRGFVGPAIGLGIAGAIIGGAIAGATQPYGYYGYAPGYYDPGYAVAPPYAVAPGYVGGNAVAYCQQRFRSYDPGSGTYVGFDGLPHPCP